jgi:hypothetical protein
VNDAYGHHSLLPSVRIELDVAEKVRLAASQLD